MHEPPYAADTRAKGWRFELDYERIEQSDTWAIAAELPMAQPALLMMWLVSWTQEPCGSFPSDENVIRAKCRIPPKHWQALRSILMRGWVQAEDGRVYHPTITARVLEMLEYRRKAAERVAKFKLAAREQRDGNALPTRELPVKNDTGTGTGTGTIKEKERERGKPRPARKAPEGFSITAEMRRWAASTVPTVDVDAETEKFRDHTFSTTCIDWPGRWRNWMRKAVTLTSKPNFAEQRAALARITVPSDSAEQTRRMLDADRMTPEQKAAASKAADMALAAMGRIGVKAA